MKQNPRVLILAIILAAVSVILVKFYIQKQVMYTKKESRTVVKATKNIKAGETIEEDWVQEFNTALSTEGLDYLVKSKDNVVGKKATASIKKGEYISVYAVASGARVATRFSDIVDTNWRAFTIPVDMISGVGGFIQPGDRVDVIVTARSTASRYKEKIKSWTILTKVSVLAVGNIAEYTGFSSFSNRYTDVTIEVLPREAVILAFLMNAANARFTLTLRNRDDMTIPKGKSIDYNNLFKEAKNLRAERENLLKERR